ncbi:MAG: hypothetical protein ABI597_06320 [Gammaproteobacteria bacterium]
MRTGRENSVEDVSYMHYNSVLTFINNEYVKTEHAIENINLKKRHPKADKDLHKETEISFNNYLVLLKKAYNDIATEYFNNQLTYKVLFNKLDNILKAVNPDRGLFSNPWRKRVGNKMHFSDINNFITTILKDRIEEFVESENESKFESKQPLLSRTKNKGK